MKPRPISFRRGLFVVAAVMLSPFARPAEAVPATLIVLDASGSMRERLKGETKMDIAKRAVRELVESLPPETRLGLVVYSHRKTNACDDIELLIAPQQIDVAAFVTAVDAIQPRGRTPLGAALQFAAGALDYTKQPANIILVSDGLETCGANPCDTARKLEALGAALTVHTVAFDLSAKEARALSCLAQETGGRFLQANDSATLRDALAVAVQETSAPVSTKPPEEKLGAATLGVPSTVAAGANFPVEWTGPDNEGDFITIVAPGTDDADFGNFAYTRQGATVELTALLEVGDAEVRYVTGRSRTVLARANIRILPVEVSVSAPAAATAGSPVEVTWQGPANHGDFVTIVSAAAEERAYLDYVYAVDGSPANLAVPVEPGDAEVRYVSGQGHKVLARRKIKIAAAEVTLTAPDESTAGAEVSVTWTGPNNSGDYITIVPRSARDDVYADYEDTRNGSPLSIAVPVEPGESEVRYVSGQGRKVLARRVLNVVAAAVTLDAPDTIVAGAEVAVTWTGPGNRGDFITVVMQGTPDSGYAGYKDASAGSPARIVAPLDAGAAEVRYVSGQGRKVLARRALTVAKAEITLQAPARATAGTPVSVTWTGPNNSGDYLTIVPKAASDGTYAAYAYTTRGSPVAVNAPAAAGPCEVRYISGQGARVLARFPIEIEAAR